jgi:rubrerythrin
MIPKADYQPDTSYDRFRGCQSKKRFTKLAKAKWAARFTPDSDGLKAGVYICDYCGAYHVGHNRYGRDNQVFYRF